MNDDSHEYLPHENELQERTDDALDAVNKVRKDLFAEMVRFAIAAGDVVPEYVGNIRSISDLSNGTRADVLEWAGDQFTKDMQTPAATAYRRWMKLDRAVAVLGARRGDFLYGERTYIGE